MTALDVARAVLAKASLLDQTMASPDPMIAQAWAEALDGIDRETALQAVAAHYRSEHRRIMPADVVKFASALAPSSPLPYHQPLSGAVPDADPDDVPAWLSALRAGNVVDRSPTDGAVRRVLEHFPHVGSHTRKAQS